MGHEAGGFRSPLHSEFEGYTIPCLKEQKTNRRQNGRKETRPWPGHSGEGGTQSEDVGLGEDAWLSAEREARPTKTERKEFSRCRIPRVPPLPSATARGALRKDAAAALAFSPGHLSVILPLATERAPGHTLTCAPSQGRHMRQLQAWRRKDKGRP